MAEKKDARRNHIGGHSFSFHQGVIVAAGGVAGTDGTAAEGSSDAGGVTGVELWLVTVGVTVTGE